MTRETMKTLFWIGVIATAVLVVMFIYAAIHLKPDEWVINNPPIKVINGCQYIKSHREEGYNLTHAGNCTNEVHFPK